MPVAYVELTANAELDLVPSPGAGKQIIIDEFNLQMFTVNLLLLSTYSARLKIKSGAGGTTAIDYPVGYLLPFIKANSVGLLLEENKALTLQKTDPAVEWAFVGWISYRVIPVL